MAFNKGSLSPHWHYTTLTLQRRREMLRQWIANTKRPKKGSRRAKQKKRWIKELEKYANT